MAFDEAALLDVLEADTDAVGRSARLAARLSGEDPSEWSLLEVHRALLGLWRAQSGDGLGASALCPACDERLELELSVSSLLAAVEAAESEPRTIVADGWEIEVRPPTLADLARARAGPDVGLAAERLARACVVRCSREGRTVPRSRISRRALRLVEARLEALDPTGAPLDLVCPSCSHVWSAPLDLASLLSSQLELEARALLGEIHALASAYGWSEQAILSLPRERRREYVQLVTA
jgi:hypothetical protein